MTEIRRVYKSEEKMKIVMEGLSGTIQISDLCKKYGIGISLSIIGIYNTQSPRSHNTMEEQYLEFKETSYAFDTG